MKKVFAPLIGIAACVIFASCEKETILTVNQALLSFNNGGGSQTVNIVANKVWSASSNQSWCKVSPSSGDGSDNSSITISLSCDANTTYDARTCTVTIICEELTKIISVSQAEGKGVVVSQTKYSVSNDEQTIDIEVNYNVDFDVVIPDSCKDWISVVGAKGLISKAYTFSIAKNESYDSREGSISFKQKNSSLSSTVSIYQSQTDGLIVEQKEFIVSAEEQQISIKVSSNTDYDVIIDEGCKEWVSQIQTKGLSESLVSLHILANDGRKRDG